MLYYVYFLSHVILCLLCLLSVVDLSLGEVGGLSKEFHQLGPYFNYNSGF